MLVDISKGELIDKITILEIKLEKIKDETRLNNIRHEYDILKELEFETPYKEELRKVNTIIWDVEERLRELEKTDTFNEEFIDKARMVYVYNDDRARIKKIINLESGSDIIEEKSY